MSRGDDLASRLAALKTPAAPGRPAPSSDDEVENYLASDDWLAESTVQLPTAPTAAPSGSNAASTSGSRDRMLFSGIEVQTASPAQERSKQEEDDLINKLTAELHVDASKQKQGDAQVDAMRSRLDKLKQVRLGASSSGPPTEKSQQDDAEAPRSAAPRPLGPPPILDPYEFELAASDSDLDSSDEDKSAASSKSADSDASKGTRSNGEER